MTQGELEFLCGPWQKDRRRQDARRGKTPPRQQRNATAEDAGPSAVAWPERREMARAPRHGPSAARAAEARARRIAVEAETRASPGHRPRPCANWLKTLVRKFEKLLIGIKRKFRMF